MKLELYFSPGMLLAMHLQVAAACFACCAYVLCCLVAAMQTWAVCIGREFHQFEQEHFLLGTKQYQ